MLKKILIVILVLVLAVLGYAASKPNDFRYERSVAINAPATKIFPLLNNLRTARIWSPWEKMDSDMERIYSGNMTGKGAKYAWDGDEKIGAGNMEITESVFPSKIVSRLEFTRPMHAVNTTEFLLEEKDGTTKVTWAMYGPNTFIGKVVSVFIDCEKMVTEQFDLGLAELKKIAEAPPAPVPDWVLEQRRKVPELKQAVPDAVKPATEKPVEPAANE